jgi:hypothetical protein
MKLLLLSMLLTSCAINETIIDKRYKCMVQLVEQGVEAHKAAEACKYTFKNNAPEAYPGTK